MVPQILSISCLSLVMFLIQVVGGCVHSVPLAQARNESNLTATSEMPANQAAAATNGKRILAKVHYCYDGDTCRVQAADSLWFSVRLAGIDAPEVKGRKKDGQKRGDAARDFLNQTIKDQTIEIQQTDLDPYNRPVVEIYYQQTLLNLKLLELGYAEAYRGRTKRIDNASYLAAETRAKNAKLGIWADATYESPKAFRMRQKEKPSNHR